MTGSRRASRAAIAFAWSVACSTFGGVAANGLQFSFALPRNATTSAGVYAADGTLVRTLWRGELLASGTYNRSWDGLDDLGRAAVPGAHDIRLIHHAITYRWEGVIGNSSTLPNRERAHKSYLPPNTMAIVGDQVVYAAGYNEAQNAIHGFRIAQPGWDTQPFKLRDPFIAASMLATDAKRLYWANTGGTSQTSFVAAFDLGTTRPAAFAAGQNVCLNQRDLAKCYENQDYRGVIDVATQTDDAPTGIAVQTNGRVLAVAHGGRNRINLYDKNTGAALGQLDVPLVPKLLNQIAMAPDGDLWVITKTGVQRFTELGGTAVVAARAVGFSRVLAIAASLVSNDVVWVADGGASQQLKRLDRNGTVQATAGLPGGYIGDPTVSDNKLCFNVRPTLEWTGLAVAPDASVFVVDSCNNRIVRYHTNGAVEVPVAYLPALYTSTVDHGNPARVFANFLEFEVDVGPSSAPAPATSWRLLRNWLGGLPPELQDADAYNAGSGGFRSVETLSNGRTYGLLPANKRQALVELPANGPLRFIKFLVAPPAGHPTPWVMYENGDLGYAVTSSTVQAVMRFPLSGFDDRGNPLWASQPVRLASVPLTSGTPYYRGSFSGSMGPRFPLTGTGKVVFFDSSVQGNEGHHLGATERGGSKWLWQASPTGAMDGRGSFQTQAIDGSINYGGNAVWAHDRHVLYGYHGEFFRDLQTGRVGQANQFMHFYDNGLFIGQFGQASTRPGAVGLSGNAVSPTLVRSGAQLYLYHNDESSHGGVHRWRIDGWQDVQELTGSGRPGDSIVLH